MSLQKWYYWNVKNTIQLMMNGSQHRHLNANKFSGY